MIIIKGNGFVLRTWKKGDEESLVENANNKKIWLNLAHTFPHPYKMQDAKKWIKFTNKRLNKKTIFAIIINESAAGCIAFELGKGVYSRSATIGYWLGEKYWGKGIVTEALKLVTDYAFKNFDITRIEAKVFEWNPASARVLEKAGYSREAILKKKVFKDNKLIDEAVYVRFKN